MNRGKERSDSRVPKKWETWQRYAEQYHFEEKMRQEEDSRWAKYHAEMKRQMQHMQDRMSNACVEFSEVFVQTVISLSQALREGNIDPETLRQVEQRFNKLFPGLEAANCFFRMGLRSQDLPEHISAQKQETNLNARIVTIAELEVRNRWANSVEEVRKKLAAGEGA